ncbi:hypothetical protein [Thermococcus sp.]|uniref:ABC transporter substrate-binding protein n=1 Tax=Thermococcus sp. TaxID=35749 RepID=UPI002624BE04|nr:hypothetical protein [Thermococcus sp.]
MIAVFPASLAEIVKLVGKVDDIAGINEEVKLDYCLPELRDRLVVGKYLKRTKKTRWDVLERIKPGLILDFKVENLHSSNELYSFAERINAEVLLLDFITIEDLVDGSRLIAEKTGGDFSRLEEFYKIHLSKIRDVSESLEKRPRVAMLYRGVNVVTGANVISDAVESAHAESLGKRIRTERKVYPLRERDFIRRFSDADHLFLLTSILTNREKLEGIRDEMFDSAEWKKVKAVDEGNVHIVGSALDEESFMRWSPRLIPGIYQIGRLVHGRDFPHWRKPAKELYNLCGVE